MKLKTLIFYKTTSEIEKEARLIAKTIKADIKPDLDNNHHATSDKYDLIIPIGGDGTVLHAESNYPGIPKLPLGAGKISFLASAPLKKWHNIWMQYLKNKFLVEKRTKIICKKIEALNEIYITKKSIGRIFVGDLTINEEKFSEIRSDGIIISTPTGSTAYNYSVGGNIVHPEIKGFSVLPVAPCNQENKRLIIPESSVIKIFCHTESILVIDGVEIEPFPSKTEFVIKKANRFAKFIQFKSQPSFYHKLQNIC